MMLCPYCLNDVRFDLVSNDIVGDEDKVEVDLGIKPDGIRDSSNNMFVDASDMVADTKPPARPKAEASVPSVEGKVYECPICSEIVPLTYVEKYNQYPPVVVSAVGHTAHGKTVYLDSLLYLLRGGGLLPMWRDFHCTPLDEFSLKQLSAAGKQLSKGELPLPTQQTFPRPVLLRLENIPSVANSTLAIYDTSGEAYESVAGIGRYARFVSHARFKLLLISISAFRKNGDDVAVEMDEHLDMYRLGMERLGAKTEGQDLIVVYTMADELMDVRDSWGILWDYVLKDDLRGLSSMRKYMYGMHLASQLVSVYTARGIGAMQVIAKARHKFRSVRFFMVSALGAPPNKVTGRLDYKVVPRRVIDPLLACLPHQQQ